MGQMEVRVSQLRAEIAHLEAKLHGCLPVEQGGMTWLRSGHQTLSDDQAESRKAGEMKKPAEEAEEKVGETGRAVEGLCGRLFGVESRVAVRMETLEEGAWLHQLEGTVEGLLEYRLSFLLPCSSPHLLPLPHAALSLTASLGPLPLPAPLSLLLEGVRASCSPRLFFAALRSWVLCYRLRRLSLAALRTRFPSRVSVIREDGLCAHT